MVVVIVGILAAVAYPSYRRQAIRANRTEAKVALMALAGNLEKCYTRWHSYDPDDGCDVETDYTTESGNYIITAVDVDATSYELHATPLGGQQDDMQCGALTINEAGLKDKTGTGTVRDCW